ncbi:MAG: xanthine dehydrogenase family protein molybdopterin-binding subunit, partial [Acidobacteriota bacterium]|nr:xanthine dehydrogenase family protein molybdopterin-binding subunit [Acidobacteriota bacterium]
MIGKPHSRLDGGLKASGKAKYASDYFSKDLLFARMLTSPHAHARVVKIDVADAKSLNGVTAVRVISPAGTEIQWAGTEVAAVAAISEEIARDAIRRIKVEYEVLPHLVKEEDLAAAGPRAKAS